MVTVVSTTMRTAVFIRCAARSLDRARPRRPEHRPPPAPEHRKRRNQPVRGLRLPTRPKRKRVSRVSRRPRMPSAEPATASSSSGQHQPRNLYPVGAERQRKPISRVRQLTVINQLYTPMVNRIPARRTRKQHGERGGAAAKRQSRSAMSTRSRHRWIESVTAAKARCSVRGAQVRSQRISSPASRCAVSSKGSLQARILSSPW